MNKVLGGVGGVLAAVAVYWLTQGVYTWWTTRNHPAPSPAPAATVTVEGRVVDGTTKYLVSGAEVSLAVGSTPDTEATDSQGRYLFVLTQAVPGMRALLSVQAQGYQTQTSWVSLQTSSSQPDIELPVQKAAASPQPATVPAVRLTNLAVRIPYKRRELATAVRITPKGSDERRSP